MSRFPIYRPRCVYLVSAGLPSFERAGLYLGDGAEFPRVSLIGSGSGNSNSLIYGQNSLFRSLGNSLKSAVIYWALN